MHSIYDIMINRVTIYNSNVSHTNLCRFSALGERIKMSHQFRDSKYFDLELFNTGLAALMCACIWFIQI